VAHQSLYRRYRPRRFGEVRGQDHVVTALRNAVANSTEGHAYLFSGPRGTGKTSTARILAKALNCENLQGGEPCCDCTPCQDMEAGRSYDLFELDAASNNGVDAIRDLIERAAVGSPGRTKVYILDEVHMLSPGASNALLKTLEEPPDHVRFVLATTDPQKVLPTIRSRTQHFEFQLLAADELERYVRWIVSDADLDVDESSVAWSVRQGRGSARDTLSALDQVVAAGGVVDRAEPVDELFAAITGKDAGAAVSAVADALAQGHDPRVLAKSFLDALRDAFLLSLGVDVPHLVDADRASLDEWAQAAGTPLLTRSMEAVGSAMVDMRNAADPRVPLEVALVRLATAGTQSFDALVERIERLEAAIASGAAAAPAGAGAAPAGAGAAAPSAGAPVPEAAVAEDEAGVAGGGPAQARAALQRLRKASSESAAPPAARAEPASAAPPEPPPTPPTAAPRRSSPPAPPVPPAKGAPAPSEPPAREPSSPAPAAEAPSPPTATEPQAEPAAPAAAPAGSPPPAPATPTSGAAPTVDAVRAALAEAVLPQLKGVAKALYSTGEVVSVDARGVVFALAIGVPRDRAERAVPDVQRLLSDHFGTSVSLRVVEHDDAEALDVRNGNGSAPGAPAGRDDAPPPADADDGSVIDVHSLEDAHDVAQTGIERLTKVFPGATVIEDDEVTR
jgi:DNA polymerase-3 subunit gamma/tau